jgi:hypothetical protein
MTYPTPDLFTKALALLAFVVGFYALAARERKTPYLTNSLYSTAFWVFVSSVLLMVAQFIEPSHTSTAHILTTSAQVLLVSGALNITYGIWRVHNRHVNFRDDNLIKNLGAVRAIRAVWRQIWPKPSYEYDAPSLFPEIKAATTKLLSDGVVNGQGSPIDVIEDDGFSKSVVYQRASLSVSDETLITLAKHVLGLGWGVQYTTCIRHPIEFVTKLQRALDKSDMKPQIADLLGQVVVIDGYTPHFGFTDSVHSEKARQLKRLGVLYVKSRPSYAGVHTATAKGFNKFKKLHKAKNVSRRPTLVIYEGTYALVALESIEQYYIFIRHVLPSERMWGGMLTFFIEPIVSDEASELLSTLWISPKTGQVNKV